MNDAPLDLSAFAAGDEFQPGAAEWDNGVSRRNFLKVMGASIALAGAGGCEYKPGEKIVPYVNPPEQVVAGKPMYFATAMPLSGYGYGVLAESHEGRPTKIEGNPDHPASLGATNVFMQASVLSLYDPSRATIVTRAGSASSWGDFFDQLGARLQKKQSTGGEGIRLLTGTITSPTLGSLLGEFQQRYPQARWHQHEPALPPRPGGNAIYQFDKAKVILSLDSDFLIEEPGSVRYARDFSDGRRVRKDRTEMNRLYVVEGTYTITGSMADHRKAVRPSRIESIAAAFAAALGVQSQPAAALPAGLADWVRVVADDLKRAGPAALVVPGQTQTARVQALAVAMNQALGSIGTTVSYTDAVEVSPQHGPLGLGELTEDMKAGKVDTLLILGGNPAYTQPADVDFAGELQRLSEAQHGQGPNLEYFNFTAHFGPFNDETSFLCQWHVPESHYLESWGDVRAYDGTVSIIQPLVVPLYSSHSVEELLSSILGRPELNGYEILRSHWAKQAPPDRFEQWWQAALRKGVIADTAMQGRPQTPSAPVAPAPGAAENPNTVEVIFRPDPTIYDGSFASNGWLQELPKPFTKLVWDNAALMSPATAARYALAENDMVTLNYRGKSAQFPVLMLPGQADDCVTVHLGYGRTRAGDLGNGSPDFRRGFNAYALRFADALWFAPGVSLTKENNQYDLVVTRSHHAMDPLVDTTVRDAGHGLTQPQAIATPRTPDDDIELKDRRLVRVANIDDFRAALKTAHPEDLVKRMGGEVEEKKRLLSLYPGWDYSKGYQWAMSIDINSCIGCNACVIACQSENNSPVVGKEQVARQREMHWIRIDDYFGGNPEDPKVYHEPVPCMHCENAPCELVCPVGATTHSVEGLNEMTYNRCVGTRYCSNNCPYKVRRFNFLHYGNFAPSVALQRNPEVTVRSRGVMEKCSYCIQRITRTRIEIEKAQVELEEKARQAENEAERQKILATLDDNSFRMKEQLQTACEQACPARAIVFGDKNDPRTDVAALKREPLNYTLLTELTTVPRTSYLARLRNPNPDLHEGRGEA